MALNDSSKGKPQLSKTMKAAREYTHLFEAGWGEGRGICCGLSESYPIHDFREPPGIGKL